MSSTAATGSAPGATPVLEHRQILFIIFGLMAGMFLSALDQTVVGTSMRTIADDLHGLSIQAWVTTAYLITSTVSTPIYGKLSDIFGRRPLFIIAITIFMAGSLCCRVRELDVLPRGHARDPGSRRRRPDGASARDHGRHPRAARAREVPGLLPRRVRHLERRRAADRRAVRRHRGDPGHRRMALGVPDQHPGRHRGALPGAPLPAYSAHQAAR